MQKKKKGEERTVEEKKEIVGSRSSLLKRNREIRVRSECLEEKKTPYWQARSEKREKIFSKQRNVFRHHSVREAI